MRAYRIAAVLWALVAVGGEAALGGVPCEPARVSGATWPAPSRDVAMVEGALVVRQSVPHHRDSGPSDCALAVVGDPDPLSPAWEAPWRAVACLDSSGEAIWLHETTSNGAFIVDPPRQRVIDWASERGDLVYEYVAYDFAGNELWRLPSMDGSQALSQAGDLVHLPVLLISGHQVRGEAFAVDATGALLFKAPLHSTCVPEWDIESTRFFFTSSADRGTGGDSLKCYSRDGTRLWSRWLGSGRGFTYSGITPLSVGDGIVACVSTIHPSYDQLVAGDSAQHWRMMLAAYDYEGREIWRAETAGVLGPVACSTAARGSTVSAVLRESTASGGWEYVLKVFDQQGRVAWSHPIQPSDCDSRQFRLTELRSSPFGRFVCVSLLELSTGVSHISIYGPSGELLAKRSQHGWVAHRWDGDASIVARTAYRERCYDLPQTLRVAD